MRGIREFNFEKFELSNFSSVIYVAQSRSYKDYPAGLADLAYMNIFLPIRFAEVCSKMNIPFVYTSTGSVYQRSNIPIREDFPFIAENEANAYSSSKLFADQYLSSLRDFSKITIVRPFFIFGKGAKRPALFPSLIHAINVGETIKLRGKNGLLFNPIASQDAARAVLHLVERKEYGIYNLGGNEEVNLRMVCEKIGSFFEKRVLFSEDNDEVRFVSNQSKLVSTGFEYKDNFEENFQKYLLKTLKD